MSYSPMWDIYPAVWTAASIQNGKRHLLKSSDDLTKSAAQGQLKGLQGGEVKSIGFVVNCPIVAFTDEN